MRVAVDLALTPIESLMVLARSPIMIPRLMANLERMLAVAEELNANAAAMAERAGSIEERMAGMEEAAEHMSTQLGTFVRLTSPIDGAQGAAQRVLRGTLKLGGMSRD